MNGVSLVELLPIDEATFWLVVKLGYVFGLLVYVVFSVVVVRQVKMMIDTLDGMLVLPIRLLARIHLIAAIVVLALAVVVL